MNSGGLADRMSWARGARDRRQDAMPQSVRDGTSPAALCRVGGRVVSMNGAMAATGARGQTLETVLDALVDFDAALVYRLSRSSVTVGFALEQVRARRSERVCYLSAVRVGEDLVLWRVLDMASLSDAALPSMADHYEAAPFAYLYVESDGTVSSNIRFRDQFGEDTAPILSQLTDGEGGLREGCVDLIRPDGRCERVHVLVPGCGSGMPHREVFLFDCLTAMPEAGAESAPISDLPIPVMRLGEGGRILSLNAAAAAMLGEGVAIGRPLDEIVACRGRRIAEVIDAAAEAGEARVETVMTAPTDPSARPLQLTVSSTRDAGGSAIAVLSDATEFELLQDKYAQSQKMEAVGKLAGGVAHDFNNLITAINGHCDLLLIGKDATQPEYSDLMQIRQNANRAAALVRQLLTFSRKQTLNPEDLSVSDVISDTLYLLDRLIGDQVKLRLDSDPSGAVGQVRADHRQLEQAL
ncbi:MAG: histidine kinase dimerization/phospho-acceptor domain-containing protein, partial [Pseudomonadota bacterium]